MTTVLRTASIALVLMFMAFGPAAAHTKSETHQSWRIADRMVYLGVTIPALEANRIPHGDGATPSDALVSAYLSGHIGVTAQDTACYRAGEPRAIASAADFRRFELVFACPTPTAIALTSSAFFDLVPSHVTFAQIVTADGQFIEQLFTRDHQTLSASADADNPLQDASFLEYIWLGIEHILTGPDHMSFLLGLVLISRNLRDLIFVVTGFTLGHSLTLALAVTGVIRPHAEYIDALVALTIVLIGSENVAIATHRPAIVAASVGGLLFAMAAARLAGIGTLPPLLLLGGGLFAVSYLMMSGHLKDAGRLRILVTVAFGIIHGFGFASSLMEMRLPSARLAELLFGFNLGVEIGQLSLVLATLAVVALLVRFRWSLPRPLVVDVAAAAVVAVGLNWFITRSFA